MNAVKQLFIESSLYLYDSGFFQLITMKVLTMFVNEFSYIPAEKNLEEAETVTDGAVYHDAVLAFIHVESNDEAFEVTSREKKLVNHLKWVCRKNQSKRIILHSFAHLSGTKASVKFTSDLLNLAEERLKMQVSKRPKPPSVIFSI